MRRHSLVVPACLLTAGVLLPVLAQKATPRFEDYPATEAYNGKNAPLVLTPRDREFRTRLRAAASEKPNFANHYIVTSWGCGVERSRAGFAAHVRLKHPDELSSFVASHLCWACQSSIDAALA